MGPCYDLSRRMRGSFWFSRRTDPDAIRDAVEDRRQMDRAHRDHPVEGTDALQRVKRAVGDISQRMLTLTLRNLERDGLRREPSTRRCRPALTIS